MYQSRLGIRCRLTGSNICSFRPPNHRPISPLTRTLVRSQASEPGNRRRKEGGLSGSLFDKKDVRSIAEQMPVVDKGADIFQDETIEDVDRALGGRKESSGNSGSSIGSSVLGSIDEVFGSLTAEPMNLQQEESSGRVSTFRKTDMNKRGSGMDALKGSWSSSSSGGGGSGGMGMGGMGYMDDVRDPLNVSVHEEIRTMYRWEKGEDEAIAHLHEFLAKSPNRYATGNALAKAIENFDVEKYYLQQERRDRFSQQQQQDVEGGGGGSSMSSVSGSIDDAAADLEFDMDFWEDEGPQWDPMYPSWIKAMHVLQKHKEDVLEEWASVDEWVNLAAERYEEDRAMEAYDFYDLDWSAGGIPTERALHAFDPGENEFQDQPVSVVTDGWIQEENPFTRVVSVSSSSSNGDNDDGGGGALQGSQEELWTEDDKMRAEAAWAREAGFDVAPDFLEPSTNVYPEEEGDDIRDDGLVKADRVVALLLGALPTSVEEIKEYENLNDLLLMSSDVEEVEVGRGRGKEVEERKSVVARDDDVEEEDGGGGGGVGGELGLLDDMNDTWV